MPRLRFGLGTVALLLYGASVHAVITAHFPLREVLDNQQHIFVADPVEQNKTALRYDGSAEALADILLPEDGRAAGRPPAHRRHRMRRRGGQPETSPGVED